MIDHYELWFGKDMEGSSHGLFYATLLKSKMRAEETINLAMISDLWSLVRTWT
jgi:hypothetical protein